MSRMSHWLLKAMVLAWLAIALACTQEGTAARTRTARASDPHTTMSDSHEAADNEIPSDPGLPPADTAPCDNDATDRDSLGDPDLQSDTDIQQGDTDLQGDSNLGGDAADCTPSPGLGSITCACNSLDDTEWLSTSPFLFTSAIDVGTAGFVESALTPGAAEVIADGNLGGSSIRSEALAVEVLSRCEGATLLYTEGEVDYLDAGGKKTDEVVEIDGRKVGVSVVRAFTFPLETPYTEAAALSKITSKFNDLPLSKANAKPEFAWSRSLLHVIAYDQQAVDVVMSVWQGLGAEVRGDAILFVTATNGNDAAFYE